MLLPLPKSVGRFFHNYFEIISIVYHFLFLYFLLYLLFFRDKDKEINTIFIRFLGFYVFIYAFVIFVWGPNIINRRIWRDLF
jgi:hypothetical protein